MPWLIVRGRDGAETVLEFAGGLSLMELIRDHCPNSIAALCGGGLSCGTCHIYIEAGFIDRLPAPDAEEKALIGRLEHRRETSRLSCQIPLTAVLDGLRVTIASKE